ncbi:hypothetical protein [Streptomyces sp. enrichment culture]
MGRSSPQPSAARQASSPFLVHAGDPKDDAERSGMAIAAAG